MAIESDGLKEILTTSGFGLSTTFSTSSLSGNKLLYTYADVDDNTRPYGNLFKSFNFPITGPENSIFSANFNNYALGYLNVKKIIVVEIPKGEYGELIDGKTFQLTIPVVLNSVATATTLYGTYFGFSGISTNYLTTLNSKLSEQNTYASQFGLVPSTGNNFNSNVTFLYSNDIQKPKSIAGVTTILDSAITLNNISNNKLILTGLTLSTGDVISINVISTTNSPGDIGDIKMFVGTQSLVFNAFQTIGPGITGLNPIIWDNIPNVISKNINIYIRKQDSTDLSWNAYSLTNKFPINGNSTTGKMYARYEGTNQDKPVGILYNDKGIAVITDQTLVSGFRFSAGTSSGYNSIASGSTYNGDTNFAKIYFTSSSLSQSTFNSITSEFVQNIMCIAGLNEFSTTTNTTFEDSYDENATEKPVFITTIGLYNAAKELIGIGKLSEPVKKTEGNVIPFSIKLVI
jgi:hypothetical protein